MDQARSPPSGSRFFDPHYSQKGGDFTESAQATPQPIATPEEVLATFTELMRGEKSAERLKAAEQLAKYHSLFTPKEDQPPDLAGAVSAVEAAVAALLKGEAPDA